MRRLVFWLIPIFFLTGCSTCIDECPEPTLDETEGWAGYGPDCPKPPSFSWYLVDYAFCPTVRTDLGIKIDRRAADVPLDIVDCVWLTNEQCLSGLPPEEQAEPAPIDPACAGVMVAPNWRVSPCTGAQGFPCDISQEPDVCPSPDPERCPCMCAGTIQRSGIIVVTPNLGALHHELTHYRTGLPDPFTATTRSCADGIDEMSCEYPRRSSALMADGAPPLRAGEIVW